MIFDLNVNVLKEEFKSQIFGKGRIEFAPIRFNKGKFNRRCNIVIAIGIVWFGFFKVMINSPVKPIFPDPNVFLKLRKISLTGKNLGPFLKIPKCPFVKVIEVDRFITGGGAEVSTLLESSVVGVFVGVLILRRFSLLLETREEFFLALLFLFLRIWTSAKDCHGM